MAKRATDLALEHDHLGFVITQYMSLEDLSLKFIEREEVRHELSNNHPWLFKAIHTFHLELLITIACAKLKLPHLQSFADSALLIKEYTTKMSQDFDEVPTGLAPYLDSIHFWWYLYGGGSDVYRLPVEFSVAKLQDTADRRGPHQTHDLRLLKALPDQKEIMTKDLLPFKKSSAWLLPILRTSFYKSVPGFEQRSNFKGWKDISMLRSLDGEKRNILNVLQTTSRTEVTNFDRL